MFLGGPDLLGTPSSLGWGDPQPVLIDNFSFLTALCSPHLPGLWLHIPDTPFPQVCLLTGGQVPGEESQVNEGPMGLAVWDGPSPLPVATPYPAPFLLLTSLQRRPLRASLWPEPQSTTLGLLPWL